jgi:gluconolactonase
LLYISSLDSVQIYSPSGELLRKIPVPEKIGNLCFGGKDGRDMYIAASTSLYRYRMNDSLAL